MRKLSRALKGIGKNQPKPPEERANSPAPAEEQKARAEERSGLFELHVCPSDEIKAIDIVAVHGLGGHWKSTWTAEGDKLWLRDFLPDQLSASGIKSRIMSFGYDSRTIFTKAVTDIDDASAMLLDYIDGMRQSAEEKKRPLMFVAHSLGGIVVKKAMILGHERSNIYSELLAYVKAVVFFGVPHRGADLAFWLEFPAKLLEYGQLGFSGNSAFVSALKRNSPTFASISQSFVERGSQLMIRTFYETQRIGNQLIVDKDSARLMLPNEVAVGIADSDHREMCRFDQAERQRYRPVWVAIKNMASEVLKEDPVANNISWERCKAQEDPLDAKSNATYLAMLPYARGSGYNSSDRAEDRKCLPGTRVDILRQMTEWSQNESDGRIFWLCGMAGTGKSTIARTISEMLDTEGILGASFFFSRDGNDTSHASKFFPTLAKQLAAYSKCLKKHVCEAIAQDVDIIYKSKIEQWKKLVLAPLSKINQKQNPLPLCIVIDALDECLEQEHIRRIIQLLSHGLSSLKEKNVRAFITSRPESLIRRTFSSLPRSSYKQLSINTDSEPQSTLSEEISLFLKHELNEIRDFRQDCGLPIGWPGDQTIKLLVHRSAGLYIYAATVCRFIRAPLGVNPNSRLKYILGENVMGSSNTRYLDKIYLEILRASIAGDLTQAEREEVQENFRKVVGSIMVLSDPLSSLGLTELLFAAEPESESVVAMTLEPLYSVLNISQDNDAPIRFLHPSFRDFLLDKDRCDDTQFWIDEKLGNAQVAQKCIALMSSKLKKNICNFPSLDSSAASLGDIQITQYIPSALQYACQYWLGHIDEGSVDLFDDGLVHIFLKENFLHWVEVISILNKLRHAIEIFTRLESMLEVNFPFLTEKQRRSNASQSRSAAPRLSLFARDGRRFLLTYQSILSEAPLQIYVSGLIFSPTKCEIKTHFRDQIPKWVQAWPPMDEKWDACLYTIQTSHGIEAVAFSPCGRHLVSGLANGKIQLWSTQSGILQSTLRGHSNSVTAVEFSKDGQLLASGSRDKSVRVWDLVLGTLKNEFVRHRGKVCNVLFTANSQQLISASFNEIRIWDLSTDEQKFALEGHEEEITALEIHPQDTQLLASGSGDATIRLWNVETGGLLALLDGHDRGVRSLAFSPNGELLASVSIANTVRLWDIKNRKVSKFFAETIDKTLAPAPLAANVDQSLLIKDRTIFQGTVAQIWSACIVIFSPDGLQVASSMGMNRVQLWDVISGKSTAVLDHPGRVCRILFSPDGKFLISYAGSTVFHWNMESKKLCCSFPGEGREISVMESSRDGQILAVTSYSNIRLWDMKLHGPIERIRDHESAISRLSVSINGKFVASAADRAKNFHVMDVHTGKSLHIQELKGSICELTFSLDSRWLLIMVYRGIFDSAAQPGLYSLDLETNSLRLLFRADSERDNIYELAISPDSQLCALHYGDRKVTRVFKLKPAKLCFQFEDISSKIPKPNKFTKNSHHWAKTPVFSADGQLLATTLKDGTIALWDTRTGESCHPDMTFEQTSWQIPPMPSNSTLSFDTKDQWVSFEGSKVLRIPSHFRINYNIEDGGQWAACCNTIVLGCENGRVLRFSFKLNSGFSL